MSLSTELEAFIQSELGVYRVQPLAPSTRLQDDLGIDGDDADAFMGAFADRFSIEPGDFDFHRYFNMERAPDPFLIFSLFSKWLHKRWGIKQYKEKEPITLAMLQRAIELGTWHTETLSDR